MIRPWICNGSPIFNMNSWTLLQSRKVVNPGKYSTQLPLALHQLCPKFCIVMNSWTKSTFFPSRIWCLGSDSSFQGTTQNPKMHKPSRARDWWLLHHWPKINVSMKNSLIVRLSTFRYAEHLFQCEIFPCFFLRNVKFLSNSFPWIQMLPMLKTWLFPKLKNVCYCLVLHFLKNGPIYFALDHSPCARIIVTLTKGLVLWRC